MSALHNAVAFLLGHVIRHGDGVAVPAAETHLKALTDEAAIEVKPEVVPTKPTK
jgi:hypothetical protein